MRYLIAALLLAPAAAFAGGYAIPNEDPRDLALSQATVAAQTGPEAAHTNPSALAGQKGLAVTPRGLIIYNITNCSDPALRRSTVAPDAHLPPAGGPPYCNTPPKALPCRVRRSLPR